MNTRTLALAALALAAAAHAGQQAHTILFKPVKGSKTVYSLSFVFDSTGTQVTYQAKLTNEVVDVKEDGAFIVVSYQSDHVTIVNGKKEPSQAETITAVTTYDKYGRPTAVGGDEATPASFRVANLTSFIAPQKDVEVGESWVVDIPANEKEKTPAIKHTYKLVTVQDGVAIVEMTALESLSDYPGSVRGRVWVELKTGEQTKFDLAVKNMPIGEMYVDGKVLITRQ